MAAHRGGGQAQFVERPVPKRRESRLAPLLDRVIDPLALRARMAEIVSELAKVYADADA